MTEKATNRSAPKYRSPNNSMPFRLSGILLTSFLLASILLRHTDAEFFSSTAKLTDLIAKERVLVFTLNEFIRFNDKRLAKDPDANSKGRDDERTMVEKLRRFAMCAQEATSPAEEDVEAHLAHPVSQFRLIARLAQEWNRVALDSLDLPDYADLLDTYFNMKDDLPDHEDVVGAAQSIVRLQETYALSSRALASGDAAGVRARAPLSADDCFEIGLEACDQSSPHFCAGWMIEALRRSGPGDRFSKLDALESLADAYAQLGCVRESCRAISRMLSASNGDEKERAKRRLALRRCRAIADDLAWDRGHEPGCREISRPVVSGASDGFEMEFFKKLCRDELRGSRVSTAPDRNLKCYRHTNNRHPRLVLRPVKLEELSRSPHVVRFYDVISDAEIERVKSLAIPALNRARVGGIVQNKTSDERISQIAWLAEGEGLRMSEMLSARVSDITALDTRSAASLQVQNYGIGGQFTPHTDFFRVPTKKGNRIATFLFYFSDVPQGGSTAFTEVGVAARALKGSAVFWYNLYPSGVGDVRTEHSSCPVLTGNKWSGNLWLRERGQEFIRRCGLDQFADNRIF